LIHQQPIFDPSIHNDFSAAPAVSANLRVPFEKMVITSGEKAADGHVPKKDLIANLQLMMEMNELIIPRDLPGVPWLLEEFRAMRAYPTTSGETRYEAPQGEQTISSWPWH